MTTVTIKDAPTVPLSPSEVDVLIIGEMKRRAFDAACETWKTENPNAGQVMFINADAFDELRQVTVR